ncbi:MAG: hypothetical protein HOV80_01060 [Polyangiaceae bacterium]|nr:hypothetical protein [Polyangiaceae bacterium]
MFVLGCGAKVVIEEEEVLAQGEGGYLGTGEPDIESAVKEACDVLLERLPDCNQKTCVDQARELFRVGEKSGCAAEAVSLMYCAVLNADEFVCLGHHRCDEQWVEYEDCWHAACTDQNNLCGL